MDSSETPQPTSIHLSEELRQLAESAPNIKGVNLSDVQEGDVLLLSTQNSLYTFRVRTPANHKERVRCTGAVQGGRFEEPAQDVQILGSTITGGALLEDKVKEDMKLEFRVPLKGPDTLGRMHKVIITSTLKSIKRLEAASIGS